MILREPPSAGEVSGSQNAAARRRAALGLVLLCLVVFAVAFGRAFLMVSSTR